MPNIPGIVGGGLLPLILVMSPAVMVLLETMGVVADDRIDRFPGVVSMDAEDKLDKI